MSGFNMDKRFFFGVCTGLIIATMSIINYLPDVAEAVYSIPPTQAWRSINIDNNATFTPNANASVQAINYRDTLFLVTDGSIILNITEIIIP